MPFGNVLPSALPQLLIHKGAAHEQIDFRSRHCRGRICAIFALPLAAAVIPPIGLSPGSPYQLIFVTADTTQATSSASPATIRSCRPKLLDATWAAIVSTANVGVSTAPLNAFSDGTLPVYNTAGSTGSKRPGGGGLNGPAVLLQNLPDYDQNGNLDVSTAWSGTSVFGRLVAGNTYLMGEAAPIIGVDNLNSDVGQWIDNLATEPNTNSYPIYARRCQSCRLSPSRHR